MAELAYVGGKFVPLAEAVVSVEDRGYQFGDAVYEVVAAYEGRPFLIDRHIARLRRSLEAIRIEFDPIAVGLPKLIAEGLQRADLGDALAYVQVSRGVAPRSHVIPKGIRPVLVLTFRRLPVVSDELRGRGARAITTLDTRWSNCYVKAVTLLPNVIAKDEALRRGYDEAIFVSADGEVRECTSANLFIVRDGILRYPPLDESVLHGVTLGFVLECAGGLRIPVKDEVISRDALHAADEVFLSSTTTEVLGITSIDDRPVRDGRVGPITQQLFREFRARSRAVAREAARI